MRDKWELSNEMDKYTKAANEMQRLDKEMQKLQKALGKVNDRRDACRRIKAEAREAIEVAVFDKSEVN